MNASPRRMKGWQLRTTQPWLGWVGLVVACYGAWMAIKARSAAATPEARSVLYPPRALPLLFQHRSHPHVGCEQCHRHSPDGDTAHDYDVPHEAQCRTCHAAQTRTLQQELAPRLAVPHERDCGYCHRGYRQGLWPVKVVAPAARLHFSHAMHRRVGLVCHTCHAPRSTGDAMGEPTLPSMAQCLSCHQQRNISQRCASCHLSTKDGRLVLRFGEQWLRPRGRWYGDDHGTAFVRTHARLARAQQAYCEHCHAPERCLSCHAGTLRPMSIHFGDYLTAHALDARRNQPRCADCHRAQSFCLSCHLRSGVAVESQKGGFRPHTAQPFHPPGFSSPTLGPGHHALAARRNLSSCVACHTESSCKTCHATGLLGGGGVSPHGRGFAYSARCRSLRLRNTRVCLQCHAPDDGRLDCR